MTLAEVEETLLQERNFWLTRRERIQFMLLHGPGANLDYSDWARRREYADGQFYALEHALQLLGQIDA